MPQIKKKFGIGAYKIITKLETEGAYDISYYAEKYGFVLWVHFMVSLLTECMKIKEQ